ncbi:glycogenin [Histoplasma ohiense]|nr:glycogenin [Histoplasma ohiense (nom. inval.)]
MADMGEAVYCTMLLSDNYLPGAMVLAHSLRDSGSKAKLVVLVSLDSLKPSTLGELKAIYDDIIPINRFVNRNPANLYLMNRPDLISTFSKIELWRQTQYSKIVYIDADVVSLRAPNELLKLETHFAAVPDIGWPDCFNTGLMVLTPNMQDYHSLLALAQRGISFDGADQGLLNIHFKKWDRLSFIYNCTPSGHYQYVPAFRHFGSNISLVHYIGMQKPWNLPRQAFPLESPYNQLLGRWWATYDRHYKPVKPTGQIPEAHAELIPGAPGGRDWDQLAESLESIHPPETPCAQVRPQTHVHPLGASFTPAEVGVEVGVHAKADESIQQVNEPHDVGRSLSPKIPHVLEIDNSAVSDENSAILARPTSFIPQPKSPKKSHDFVISAVPQYVHGEEHVSVYRHTAPLLDIVSDSKEISIPKSLPITSMTDVPALQQLPQGPTESTKQPELEHITASSEEPESAKAAPETSFSPPKAEWDPSRAPPPADSKPEAFSLPSNTYTMSQDIQLFQPPKSYPEVPKNMYYQVPPRQQKTKTLAPIFPWETYAPKPTRVFLDESIEPVIASDSHSKLLAKGKDGIEVLPDSAPSPSAGPPPSMDPWLNYVHSNAWDEIPEIVGYMRSIQRPRRGQVQVLQGGVTSTTGGGFGTEHEGRRPSLRLTDFPTEIERPSLPVTPAPIQRSKYMGKSYSKIEGGKEEDDDSLPPAAGVPSQENWVRFTIDAFVQLLGLTYLYWRLTEPRGAPRGASPAPVRVT